MRRWFWGLGLVVGATTAAGARAALLHPEVSFTAGISVPASGAPFTELWGVGYGFGAGLHYRAGQRLVVGAEVALHRHHFDGEAYERTLGDAFPFVTVNGNDAVSIAALGTAELLLRTWGTTKPYAAVGLGYYDLSFTQATASGPNAGAVQPPRFGKDGLGLKLGLGAVTPLSPSSVLFFEAAWHVAFADPTMSYVPVRAGVRF